MRILGVCSGWSRHFHVYSHTHSLRRADVSGDQRRMPGKIRETRYTALRTTHNWLIIRRRRSALEGKNAANKRYKKLLRLEEDTGMFLFRVSNVTAFLFGAWRGSLTLKTLAQLKLDLARSFTSSEQNLVSFSTSMCNFCSWYSICWNALTSFMCKENFFLKETIHFLLLKIRNNGCFYFYDIWKLLRLDFLEYKWWI